LASDMLEATEGFWRYWSQPSFQNKLETKIWLKGKAPRAR